MTLPPRLRKLPAVLAMTPTIFFVVVVLCFGLAWTIWTSFTASKLLPTNSFVGMDQYVRLFASNLWQASIVNVSVFGLLFIGGCLTLGYVLAVLLDQNIRFEDGFRTIFLMSASLSFIVTGIVWQWVLDPTYGVQAAVRGWGFEGFRFDFLTRQDTAIYALVGAGVWQATGLGMVIMLAGLRGIDQDIWNATRIDGVAKWKVYVHVIPAMIRPMIATAAVLLSLTAIKIYDLVVVMTGGGPGTATEVPAKYVMDMLFQRSNLGQATAAATIMLLAICLLVGLPFAIIHFRRKRSAGGAH
ncbi:MULTISPECIES: sugar ABC transporter permease [Rhizobium/Agrobacterium group]|uniref:carbohydrate ABC transporter permease n=1 Tax=Rhizobium/Agrobacterium group TaxID=227290 RepID=UPI001ADC99D2|nr:MULTISPECIES: sugar ABC transporter permease [Rhizobium/Agrobacterium group]MBO9112478.1 sugar ABC transporter permease [Agrobacterium sp. S2/73]QXZ75987.1 sugar ABC transporter permease [Agrobacterium sp. S7/73]QYA17002.1 sugar ABC transporter permease [Rhizobium sp. AB2/73]UEQ85425.1 sugar ABC transporter permease [Rhizobium sp. AB2/73]